MLCSPISKNTQAVRANPALDLSPFGRWTLRDEAGQRRSEKH